MTTIARAAALLLPAALSLAPCFDRVLAAEAPPLAPDGIPVSAGRSVSGTFQAPGAQAWRVYVRKGRHYAVYGTADPTLRAVVRAAGGRVLGSFDLFDSTGDAEGADFTAPYTGLVSVTVTAPPACDAGREPCARAFPSAYTLSASRDCAGGPATRCGIAPGRTLHGLGMAFVSTAGPGDQDWFRVRLEGGRRYVASLPEAQADCLVLGFRDAAGRPAGKDKETCAPGGGPLTPPAVLAPARSGTYFVVVGADDESTPSSYSLSLSRPGR